MSGFTTRLNEHPPVGPDPSPLDEDDEAQLAEWDTYNEGMDR